MKINILISTTRQWNPGDEFILLGVLNILETAFGDNINPIIYNRNPDCRVGSRFRNRYQTTKFTLKWDMKNFKGKGLLREIFRLCQYENSFKDDMNPNNINLAVFAGTPEWYSRRLIPMYNIIKKGNIPTFYFGIGAGESLNFKSADPIVIQTLKEARILTVRDLATKQLLKEYNVKYIACPAFLASKTEKIVTKVKKIALIYATDKTVKGNKVSSEMHNYILKLYNYLKTKYDVGLICHYIDEIDQAIKDFPDIEIYYSYDSKDYIKIYNNFDLTIGGRVHGIGLSASLGIPGIMIKHDVRSSTTDGFLSFNIEIDTPITDVINYIEKISDNIESNSKKLISHKKSVKNEYVELIKNTDVYKNIYEGQSEKIN